MSDLEAALLRAREAEAEAGRVRDEAGARLVAQAAVFSEQLAALRGECDHQRSLAAAAEAACAAKFAELVSSEKAAVLARAAAEARAAELAAALEAASRDARVALEAAVTSAVTECRTQQEFIAAKALAAERASLAAAHAAEYESARLAGAAQAADMEKRLCDAERRERERLSALEARAVALANEQRLRELYSRVRRGLLRAAQRHRMKVRVCVQRLLPR